MMDASGVPVHMQCPSVCQAYLYLSLQTGLTQNMIQSLRNHDSNFGSHKVRHGVHHLPRPGTPRFFPVCLLCGIFLWHVRNGICKPTRLGYCALRAQSV